MSTKISVPLLLVLLCGGAIVFISEPPDDNNQDVHNLDSPRIAATGSQPPDLANPSRLPLDATPSVKPLASKKESRLFVTGFNSVMSSAPDTVINKIDVERADFLTNRIIRLKDANSDFDSYPFLDPHDVLQEFGGFVGSQMLNAIQGELSLLIKQTEILDKSWWGPNQETISASFASDSYVVSLPPTWVVASPLFGDVDIDTVLSQKDLLKDIRREYLYNYVMSSRKIEFYRARIESPSNSFSPAIRDTIAGLGDAGFLQSVDLSSTFTRELETLESEMTELRQQYLLALGNAVFAMQLPSFSD